MKATFCGFLALLFWSFSSLMGCELTSVPALELIGITLGLGFFVSFLRIWQLGAWTELKESWCHYLLGSLLVFLNHFCYMSAFRFAPPDQVELIDNLWPIAALLFSYFLPSEKLGWTPLLGALLGFSGIFLRLLSAGSAIGVHYGIGYGLAFLDMLAWTAFILFLRRRKEQRPETSGFYCGLGSIMAFALHFLFEKSYWPTSVEWAQLGFVGFGSIGLSYILWDFGIRKGNFKLLSLLTYVAPIASISILVLFGKTEPRWLLACSVCLVVLGSMTPWLLKPRHVKYASQYLRSSDSPA